MLSTTQITHMLENNGTDNATFTGDEQKQFISELSKIEIKGERWPKTVQVFSDVKAVPKI